MLAWDLYCGSCLPVHIVIVGTLSRIIQLQCVVVDSIDWSLFVTYTNSTFDPYLPCFQDVFLFQSISTWRQIFWILPKHLEYRVSIQAPTIYVWKKNAPGIMCVLHSWGFILKFLNASKFAGFSYCRQDLPTYELFRLVVIRCCKQTQGFFLQNGDQVIAILIHHGSPTMKHPKSIETVLQGDCGAGK